MIILDKERRAERNCSVCMYSRLMMLDKRCTDLRDIEAERGDGMEVETDLYRRSFYKGEYSEIGSMKEEIVF